MAKLSTFVELINLPDGRLEWQFQRDIGAKGFTNKDRTDQGPYVERSAALQAAASALAAILKTEVIVDDPPETLSGLSQKDVSLPGEKRRRTGGHGFSGGDGFTRLDS